LRALLLLLLPRLLLIFLSAQARTRGTNANPIREGYVFGKGSKGTGFYHQTTQDAYGILYKRVRCHRTQLQQQTCQAKFCGVVFLPLCPLIWFTDACGTQTRKRKIEELSDMEVCRAFPSCARSTLTEIYPCRTCS
jgi:hypothetical protein